MPAPSSETARRAITIDAAYRAGDLVALKQALGDPPDFPNNRQPHELGLGDFPLEYAIYWSPLAFIETLIALGAEVNYISDAGFPALIAVLSTDRNDRWDILSLLLEQGADPNQRGFNDWTPLHYAVNGKDLDGVRVLLSHGADPGLSTRIDDCATALEDAQAASFDEAVALMREALARKN